MIYLLGALLACVVSGTFARLGFKNKKRSLSYADSAREMLYDQLQEVDLEVASGLISQDDGEAVGVEIKRRLIRLEQGDTSHHASQSSGVWAIACAGFFVPVSAFFVYQHIGSPDIPSAIFSQRDDEVLLAASQEQQAQDLVRELEADVTGGASEGWVRAAQTYMAAGKYLEAANAYGRILERGDVTHVQFVRYAEALILSERGVVTPLAQLAIDRSLEMAPGNHAALFYQSFAMEQAGELEEAYSLLLTKLQSTKGRYPWMEAFVARANHYGEKLGKAPISELDFTSKFDGPTPEDIALAAKMTSSEQDAFIASMVDRLAERLKEEPDDLDGWIKLARAYFVLGDKEKSLEAYRQALPLTVGLSLEDERKKLVKNKLEELQ